MTTKAELVLNNAYNNSNNRIIDKASYSDLFDRIQDPILIFDSTTLVLRDFNPSSLIFFNLDWSEMTQIDLFSWINPQDKAIFMKHLSTLARRYNNKNYETKFYIPSKNEWHYVDIMMGSLELSDGTRVIQLILKDISESKKLQKKLESLSITDALTNLYNKRYFEQKMLEELERSIRDEKGFSLILMDIDNFKNYNDKNGHPAGDFLLKEFALEMKNRIRGLDIACRYGGEEFAIICPKTSLEEAHKVADRIRHFVSIKDFPYAKNQPLGCISASMGVSNFCPITMKAQLQEISNFEKKDFYNQCVMDLKEKADSFLYKAKESGRNKVVSS